MRDIKDIKGEYTILDGEDYFVIKNYDIMQPFFMSVVSANDHWLFISSNGALSAGRVNPENALFPYYTDDKITDSVGITGASSLFRVTQGDKTSLWEPFSKPLNGAYNCSGNLYKNRVGNKIVFEEINHDLGLSYQYAWSFSEKYGIVKESRLFNNGNKPVTVELLDGIQNIMPAGVPSNLQNERSTLIDAYKIAEWDSSRDLAIYSLSSIIVDKAEPSESLRATTVWACGISYSAVLLSEIQKKRFISGQKIEQEQTIKASKGAFFIHSTIEIPSNDSVPWLIVSEVNQSAVTIAKLRSELKDRNSLYDQVVVDVRKNKDDLRRKIGMADGIQLSNDRYGTGRHYSNVLFNIMRGGVFGEQYDINTNDFKAHIENMNRPGYARLKSALRELPSQISYHDLRYFLKASKHKDAMRYYFEYLPLSFSRRHGDPSRPWNYFNIDLKDKKGNKQLNYEGNWRDIFQNWEALAYSFPEYSLGMITKFVNASTIDGYNPYRITRQGIDWEVVDPNDPWSHIGYWGDHQVIYLTKLLELSLAFHPNRLRLLLDENIFTYANVPYRIKGYDAIVNDPKHTINFDHEVANKIERQVERIGSDGKLVLDERGALERVNLTEKILVMVLTKLYNFIPEGGIWLNTQRPEWNDANNALVGNGVSMVTLYYLRRFLSFAEKLFEDMESKEVMINKPVVDLLNAIQRGFKAHQSALKGRFTSEERRSLMDGFGIAGEHYRTTAYAGFTHDKKSVSYTKILELFRLARTYLEHSIDLNKREDGLYHSYNLISLSDNGAELTHLYKMLEGQVAVASSKYLSAAEILNVFDALKKSDMYRADQYSYMLYPDKELPSFLNRNVIQEKDKKKSRLISAIIASDNCDILEKDVDGNIHFNSDFHNADDLKLALDKVKEPELRGLIRSERASLMEVFENLFNHRSFTGRSGSFYGYEGLGSIYWHMVSKLLLSIQENISLAKKTKAKPEIVGRLIEHYYEVRAGIGINKSPELYGAFPTDAYSHTPKYSGAKQPGMTGQVKEDIINRWEELGVSVGDGQLSFQPLFLRKSEFITEASTLSCYSIDGVASNVDVPEDSLGFTFCQVPVIYRISSSSEMKIKYNDGSTKMVESSSLSIEDSKEIFKRTGKIVLIEVPIKQESLLS